MTLSTEHSDDYVRLLAKGMIARYASVEDAVKRCREAANHRHTTEQGQRLWQRVERAIQEEQEGEK